MIPTQTRARRLQQRPALDRPAHGAQEAVPGPEGAEELGRGGEGGGGGGGAAVAEAAVVSVFLGLFFFFLCASFFFAFRFPAALFSCFFLFFSPELSS